VIRIIGGEAKGRKLKSPRGQEIRPTLGRIRQVLFDLLQREVRETPFLDLFAGTGIVALEALSRGASRAALVEKKGSMVRIIRENVSLLGYQDMVSIFQGDAMRIAEKLAPLGPFGIIFADPPYTFQDYEKLVSLYLPLLDKGGILAIQHLKAFSLALPTGFSIKERKVGEHLLTLVTGEE